MSAASVCFTENRRLVGGFFNFQYFDLAIGVEVLGFVDSLREILHVFVQHESFWVLVQVSRTLAAQEIRVQSVDETDKAS